jgi:putative ABC transport system ATP-binding protein
MSPGSALLSARSLVFSFDSTPALRGISLDITDGEILAVSGPSGSGKSTLLLCLAGILRPDAGEIRYGHKRVDKLSESERSVLRRTEIGVLFQFGQLVPELTAEENVALPLLLGGSRRRPALAAARVWLDRFGVADLAAKRPGDVSGGQQQRIAVARALVTEPRVLFADEPTGALDSLSSEAVLAQMTRVAREARTTVVMVTHDATVAAYGDREIVIRDGMLDSAAPDRRIRR